MTVREVVKRLLKLGAKKVRQRGSHAFYTCARGKAHCASVVPMHAGELAKGTAYGIQADFAPCFGKGWLLS